MKSTLPSKSFFIGLAGTFFVVVSGACTGTITSSEDPPAQPGSVDTSTQAISPVACLRKAALDLTEKAPSLEDIDSVKAGTKSLGEIVDGYMSSPAFAEVVRHWFLNKFEPTSLVPDTADKEEPARIARYLVTNDIDFRQLVTADYTVGADGAKKSVGPTAAGILSTQTYLSAYTGLENRNWGGQIIKGLAGIVLAPISEVPEGIDTSKSGLAGNPVCAGCHVNPLYGVDYAASFHDCYDDKGLPIAGCARQSDSQLLGQTGRTLADLGKILAGSIEWRATMIQTFYTHLGARPIGKNETSQYRDYEQAWIAADYKPKALIKQIVTSPHYCSR